MGLRHVVAAAVLAVACSAQETLVVAETLHTMGPRGVLKGAVIVIKDGKIQEVAPPFRINKYPDAKVIRAKVVTPGFVDARSVVGLAGYLNQDGDSDQIERSGPIQPELRAIDAFNREERLVRWLRELGVTTVHTGHAPAALVSGQTMVVKTSGNGESDILKPFAMVSCALGAAAMGRDGKPPGTRPKAVAMLRQELLEAQAYYKKMLSADIGDAKAPEPNLRKLAWAEVFKGNASLLIHCHRTRDIRAAIRLGREFKVRVVLEGAAEAYEMLPEIAKGAVPVIAHAPMLRTRGDAENGTFRLGAELAGANILFAYQSGYETYVPKTRVVLWEAAIGAANGLGSLRALRAITIDAAQILGVDDRVGSVQRGKDADLALFDGDPFEYTTHCVGVLIDGKVVSEEKR